MWKLEFSDDIYVKEQEPLSKHCTFKTGGPAKYAVFPNSIEQFTHIIKVVFECNAPYVIIGKASNILFDDDGFDGVVIFTKNINQTEFIHRGADIIIKADCGVGLTELSLSCGKKHMLTGMEFLYGIPGSVGGGVYMNAGAYGGEINDIIEESLVFNLETQKIFTLNKQEHEYSYRKSIFSKNKSLIILNSSFKLKHGEPSEIIGAMSNYMSQRKEKQPLEFPSAGSTFKRPGNGLFAGKLIEDSGLKGYKIGGAKVSEKHAGFIVNCGNATSSDILNLIEHVKKTVSQNFAVTLECEVIHIKNK